MIYAVARGSCIDYRGWAIGYPRSGGKEPLPNARLPRPRLRQIRCRSGRL